MPALPAGKAAPDFALPAMDGSQFSLHDALTRGPVLLAFFKVSCPVCQFALPFIDRIYKNYGKKLTIVGVSQNNKKDTAAFLSEYGITFPVLLDDTKSYSVSNSYGLTNVPTLFWITNDGGIEISSVGWMRSDVEDIARRAASFDGTTPAAIFRPGENIPDFRAG